MSSDIRSHIINLIDSPELHDWLMEDPNRLTEMQYAEIAAGAPVDLYEKLELLTKLYEKTKAGEPGQTGFYISYLGGAIQKLEKAHEDNKVLMVSAMYASMEDGSDSFDGPFPVSSWTEAQRAISTYRDDDPEGEDDWSTSYWKIELYDLCEQPTYHGFLEPFYTYFADKSGSIQYFKVRWKMKRMALRGALEAFCSPALNLPVPWKAGDALEIDCRPYEPGPRFCVLTEVGDDCCGIQCAYPTENGIRTGALKHGHYYWPDEYIDQIISPLYRAHVWKGPLPDSYSELEKYRH